MGATLDTPAVCPVCHESLRDPVVLKCRHHFCQRCIEDLWSITPYGPYHCPQWKCTAVYQTRPFPARRPTGSPSPPSSSSQGKPLQVDGGSKSAL